MALKNCIASHGFYGPTSLVVLKRRFSGNCSGLPSSIFHAGAARCLGQRPYQPAAPSRSRQGFFRFFSDKPFANARRSVQVVALTQCAFVVRPGAATNLSLVQAWPSPPFLQATRKVASASASPFEIPSVAAGVFVGTTCKLCVSLSLYH